MTALLFVILASLLPMGSRVGAANSTTFSAQADTYFEGSTAYGTAKQLAIGSAPSRTTFMRFTVQNLFGPVTRAKVRLRVANRTDAGSNNGGTLRSMSDTNWSETGITASEPIDGPIRGTLGRVVRNAWYEIDVTPAITGDGKYSFGLTSSGTDAAIFDSRETGSSGPQLVVETQSPTPTPTATATSSPAPATSVTSTATPTASPAPTTSPASESLATSASRRTIQLSRSGAALALEYCGNGSIDRANDAVKRVVFAIHGDSRTDCSYASYVMEAAALGQVAGETLVVAPHFPTSDDVAASDSPSKSSLLYWTDGGWKSGSQSLTSPYARPWTISSFEVVDLLAAQAKSTFPNLTSIVFGGHSAGGQFVNRYAAASPVGTGLGLQGPRYSFVVANPSSYLYFDARRYRSGSLGTLTDAEVAACPAYNDYKYGLRDPNAYMLDNTAGLIPERYRTRSVVYLLGSADTQTNDESLDSSCEAGLEGSQRFERGTLYYNYLGELYGSAAYATHTKSVVPGVGHSAHDMFTSSQGVAALFN